MTRVVIAPELILTTSDDAALGTVSPRVVTTSDYSSVNVSHDEVILDRNHIARPDVRPESIIVIAGLLLSGLVAITLVVLLFTLLYRKRQQGRKNTMKLKVPSIEEIEKEYDVINGVSQENVDVLFDKKKFKKTVKQKKRDSQPKRSSPRKCRVCLDRGHKQCQGHSRASPAGSVSSVNREHLNFIEPSGFYEHIKVQTETPDVHEYTKLDQTTSGLLAPPQPLPRQSAGMSLNSSNVYANLHETKSGGVISYKEELDADANSEYEYSIPLDHYEELPLPHYDVPETEQFSRDQSTTATSDDHSHYNNVSDMALTRH